MCGAVELYRDYSGIFWATTDYLYIALVPLLRIALGFRSLGPHPVATGLS